MYLSLTLYVLYGKQKKILSDKAVVKSRFGELSNNETTEEKKQKMPYRQRQKSHKLWFEII